jgi:hypothetical protein
MWNTLKGPVLRGTSQTGWWLFILPPLFVGRQLNIVLLDSGSGIIHIPEDSSYVSLVYPEISYVLTRC